MNKMIAVVVLVVAIFGFSSAGVCNDALVVDEQGNVGIGVDAPQAKCHFNGPMIMGSGHGATSFNVASFFTTERSTDSIHIRLPYDTAKHSNMFHIKVRGYAYKGANSKIVDLTYVGYVYKPYNDVISTGILDPTGALSPVIYKGSDNHVYLRFNAGDTYFLSFAVDSMYVGNGRIIEPGEITIIQSPSEIL